MPPENINLNAANKRIDQSISDLQAGIGTAVYATLDKEQLISHTRTDLVTRVTSQEGSYDGVISGLEVHELLAKIHDILSSAVPNGLAIPFIF